MVKEYIAEESKENWPDEDYEPYDERYIRKPLKRWEAYNLIIRGTVATGMLTLPEAFRFSGILMGIVDLVIISIFITYMYHVFMHSRYTLCKILRVGILYYPQAMKNGFKIGPQFLRIFKHIIGPIVDFFMILYQLSLLCYYLEYMTRNLKKVFEAFYHHDFPFHSYALILGPYLLIIMCVRSIKIFAIFAVISNLLTLISLLFMIYHLVEDMPNFTMIPPATEFQQHILFIIPAFCALHSLPLYSTVELNLLEGRNFLKSGGILCLSYATITIVYFIIAVMGYWRFEEHVAAFITMNLDVSHWAVQTAEILYFSGIYIAYGLQGLIGVNVIWDHFSKLLRANDFVTGIFEYLFRFVVFVGVPLLIVLYLPVELGMIFCIQGFTLALLGIIFPALLEICVIWPRQNFGTCNYILVKDILLIIIGHCVLGLSCYHGYRYYSGNMKPRDSW